MTAKYSFFEMATQQGFVVALMAPRMRKSREHWQIVIDRTRNARVFQLFKSTDPERPIFEYPIPERDSTESTMMWETKVRKGLDKAWKNYTKDRSGEATPATSSSTDSKTESLSTDVLLKLECLNSQSAAEGPVPSDSDPSPSTPGFFPTEPPSSTVSEPLLPRPEFDYQSSSTESGEGSG